MLNLIKLLLLTAFSIGAHATVTLPKDIMQDILCNETVVANCKIAKSEELSGGFSGAKIYKLTTNDDKNYLFRFFAPKQKEKANIRRLKIYAKVSELNIAPKLIWSNKDIGMLTDFITVKPYTKEDNKSLEFHTGMAKLLAKAHSIKHLTPAAKKNKFKDIGYILKSINKFQEQPMPGIIDKAFTKIGFIRQNYEPLIKYSLAHNDLHFGNILHDGSRFWIIDWDNAGLSDPMFDLACYINFFIFDANTESAFVRAYDPTFTKQDYAKLEQMKSFAKGYYGIGVYRIAIRNFKDEVSKIDLQEYFKKNTKISLKDYMYHDRVNLETVEGLLEFSHVLLEEFLK